jgi:hypothetical protein
MKVRYTVPSAVTRAAYVGNDVTTVFSAPFNFFDDSDLKVILVNDTTAVETLQVLTTNYTVTGGGGSSGSVTMLVAPPTGTTLVIERNIPFTQAIDLEPNDPFPAEVTEEGFDRATMLAQQNRLEIQKSPKLPPTYDPDSDPEIRIPVPVAGQVLVGKSDATGWDNAPLTDISTADIPAVITGLADRDLLEYDLGSLAWRNQTLATVLKRMLTTAGDIAVNIAGAVSRLAIGSTGQVLTVSAGAPIWATPIVPRMHIYGLTYANNAGDATNDLDLAAGGCMDATGAYLIAVTALTKQSDVAWAVGTNAGALDTGVVGNSDYYIWAIARSDTGVTDILFSLSSTAPTMPANYDYKRLIGWFKRTGGTIVALKTYETAGGGLEFVWSAPTLDVNASSAVTTSRTTYAVKVPLTFSVEAKLIVNVIDASLGFYAKVGALDEADVAPSSTATPLVNFNVGTNTNAYIQVSIRTSATGLIYARSDLASVDAFRVVTLSFVWSRR